MERTLKSTSTAKIAEALAKAQGQMELASKDGKNSHFGSTYATLASVITASRGALAENGLAVTQMPTVDDMGNVELVTELLHVSGEWLRSYYPIRPVRNDPQSTKSAVTYARRTCLEAILNIAADDDDGNAASSREAASRPEAPRPVTPLPPKKNGNGAQRVADLPADVGSVRFNVAGAKFAGLTLREIHETNASALPRFINSSKASEMPQLAHAVRAFWLQLDREKREAEAMNQSPESDMVFENEDAEG